LTASVDAATSLSYLRGFGVKAYPVAALTWGLLVISTVVILVCTAFIVIGAWRRRATVGGAVERVPVERGPAGLGWISIGAGISSVVLLGSLIWTVIVLADISGPPNAPQVTIEVTGQQWWWKARYLSAEPSRVLTTANEFHIPTGEPVRVKLIGADVIHSFWVPALTGKTETIPGQVNQTWLEASRPGIYRGQCSEFCGWQHAHMAFLMIAEPRAGFDSWLEHQLQPASFPASPEVARGERLFVFHCGACHAVRGTEAGGTVAPDLTHLMSRGTIGAGTLPNNPGNLSGWIADPQAIKPGTRMPTLYLSGPDLQDIRTFLATLN
jgi:cytochrome c oxidase subunit II